MGREKAKDKTTLMRLTQIDFINKRTISNRQSEYEKSYKRNLKQLSDKET